MADTTMMSPAASVNAARGEEFRDDARGVRSLLPAAEIKRLSRLDAWRSSLAVAVTWGVIVVAVTAALIWWSPWVVIPAILIIGSRQHALFVLAHEATHYRLYRPRWLNDLVGGGCAAAAGLTMCTYRVSHRLHHNHLYGAEDPDIALHGGYPRGRAYLVKKLLKDLAGFTWWKTYGYFFGNPAINDDRGTALRPLDDTSPGLRAAARRDRVLVVVVQLAMLIGAFAAGYGSQYLVLWVLPALTVLQMSLRLRAVLEHGAVRDTTSPLTAARTNLAPWPLLWLLFPHHVNYHIEHHLYPAIPHYNLPETHRLLTAAGALDGAEVGPVGDSLRRIFAAPA
jgi:fatty acid desaturase